MQCLIIYRSLWLISESQLLGFIIGFVEIDGLLNHIELNPLGLDRWLSTTLVLDHFGRLAIVLLRFFHEHLGHFGLYQLVTFLLS